MGFVFFFNIYRLTILFFFFFFFNKQPLSCFLKIGADITLKRLNITLGLGVFFEECL